MRIDSFMLIFKVLFIFEVLKIADSCPIVFIVFYFL